MELKNSSENDRYRILLDAITDYAIYMLDAQGRISSWNSGAERFKGYEAAEILGSHFSRFYTKEDQAAGLPDRVLRTAATEGRYEGEGWRVKKDGTRFWAHVVVDPILTSTGKVIGYAKVTRDLTEKKVAEKQLRRSEEQFRLLVQGVTDYAIYLLDLEGYVSSWNSGAERIKGYCAEEILGKHFSVFYTDEERETGLPDRALSEARRNGRYELEGWRVRKDGSSFWASAVIDAIYDENGKLFGFAKITRDITEKRNAQIELEKAQEELLQSRKLEALGQLSGGIAHDFNNLLMTITGSLELLKKRLPDQPETSRLLSNALQGVQRGSALTARMLSFSRSQSLKPDAVDLFELVRGMGDLLQLSLGDNIKIKTTSSLSPPEAWIDASQLELALLNIAANARDAMQGEGTLSIDLSHSTEPPSGLDVDADGYVCLSVSDTGEGMDEETLQRAADPFFTTKSMGKGTGLGLSIVHGLLEASNGRMIVKSQQRKGTTVELWIPRAVGQNIRSIETEKTGSGPKTEKLTALAVEDEPIILMNTVLMLEDMGFGVIEASNGAEALKKLKANKVDLLVTDQSMPKMTGLQLMRAALEFNPDLKVILVTGYLDLPSEARELEVCKLDKPFSTKGLEAAVQQVLGETVSSQL